jgi:hypothetical protein
LMPASRHQDHTTSPSATARLRQKASPGKGAVRPSAPSRPPLPAPNVRDDRETSLFIEHGMVGILPVIWGGDQRRLTATNWHDGQIRCASGNAVK